MCVCAAQYKKKCKKQRCVLEVDVDDAAFCPAHAPKSLDLGGLLIVGSEGHARAPEDAPAGIRLHRDDRDVNEGANPVRDDVHDRALEKGEAGSDPVEARDLVAVKEVRRERSVEVALGRKGHVAAEHLGGEGREVLPGDENKEARALEGDEVALVVRAAPLRVVLRAALRARTRVARLEADARPDARLQEPLGPLPAARLAPGGRGRRGSRVGQGGRGGRVSLPNLDQGGGGSRREWRQRGSGWERISRGLFPNQNTHDWLPKIATSSSEGQPMTRARSMTTRPHFGSSKEGAPSSPAAEEGSSKTCASGGESDENDWFWVSAGRVQVAAPCHTCQRPVSGLQRERRHMASAANNMPVLLAPTTNVEVWSGRYSESVLAPMSPNSLPPLSSSEMPPQSGSSA